MPNLYFQIVSFFLSLSLLIVFKLKVKVVNKETKIYYYLLLSSFIDSLLMSIIIYIGYTNPDSFILYPLNRIDYIMYLRKCKGVFINENKYAENCNGCNVCFALLCCDDDN